MSSQPHCQKRVLSKRWDPCRPWMGRVTQRAALNPAERASCKPHGPAFALQTLPSRHAKATLHPGVSLSCTFPPALAPKAITHHITLTLPGPAQEQPWELKHLPKGWGCGWERGQAEAPGQQQ